MELSVEQLFLFLPQLFTILMTAVMMIWPKPTFAPTLMSLLKELEKGLNQEKEKLKVDEDDILSDAMSYYKQLDFDPKKRLQIQ